MSRPSFGLPEQFRVEACDSNLPTANRSNYLQFTCLWQSLKSLRARVQAAAPGDAEPEKNTACPVRCDGDRVPHFSDVDRRIRKLNRSAADHQCGEHTQNLDGMVLYTPLIANDGSLPRRVAATGISVMSYGADADGAPANAEVSRHANPRSHAPVFSPQCAGTAQAAPPAHCACFRRMACALQWAPFACSPASTRLHIAVPKTCASTRSKARGLIRVLPSLLMLVLLSALLSMRSSTLRES